MQEFAGYVQQLRALLKRGSKRDSEQLDLALDGQPSAVLRQVVSLRALRHDGAFFSGIRLARRLVAAIRDTLDVDSVITDPTCGSGDLLLAASECFAVQRTLSATLKRWGRQLAGRDIHAQFVAATTTRLALAAVRRGAAVDCAPSSAARLINDVRLGSCLQDAAAFGRATHLVMNPPFTSTVAPTDYQWGTGMVNSAAIFMDHAIRHAAPGVTVASILPDVLRSGSRYARWRAMIESKVKLTRVEVLGQFAPDVDVDVFLLVGTTEARARRRSNTAPWIASAAPREVVGDLCEVSVGPLVPFRDPEDEGQWCPVVAPKDLPRWETVRCISARRRFSGRVVDGPFVAVRRTSRPGDAARAIATIIALDRAAAVENHILVVRPRDGRLKTCQRILESLRRPETSTWLDQRIRCRHLTVGAVRELPIWT